METYIFNRQRLQYMYKQFFLIRLTYKVGLNCSRVALVYTLLSCTRKIDHSNFMRTYIKRRAG